MIASTVPANGDVNPYGIAVVPQTVGSLSRGHLLVSNFNSSANLQGTGTTIVDISPAGAMRLFSQIDAASLPGPCPGGVGLTTALVVLHSGWVIVGSLPTTDGTSATAQAGCLIVLDSMGNPVETFAGPLINGPWDMTAQDRGGEASLFFTNVLNGTVAANGQVVNKGTVARLDLAVSGSVRPMEKDLAIIASALPERTDPAALVIGPTGLGLSRDGSTLYLADSLDNRIAAVSDPLTRTGSAGPGTTLAISGFLNDPLGLTVDTSGNILTSNGNDGFVVETSPTGTQTARRLLDDSGSPPGAGALFGLLTVGSRHLYYVDDASNTLRLFIP